MKVRKKPLVVEAIQFDGSNAEDVYVFMGNDITESYNGLPKGLWIKTLEGKLYASVGDWIIKGIQGEFYPCKPDIFEQTYEKVNE